MNQRRNQSNRSTHLKNHTLMKSKFLHSIVNIQPLASIVFVSTLAAFSAGNAFAATYQWNGSDTKWQTASNWSTVTAPPLNKAGSIPVFNNAPTGQAHRLNVNGAQTLAYTSSEGSTLYANTGSGARGLVIGSGTAGSGTFEITGGTFSTLGSTAADVIGNTAGNTGTLHINGGTFIGTNLGTSLGIGGGPTCNLNISAGTARLATLNLNNYAGNINLDGGVLEVNNISYSFGIARINFNGGTLRARQSSTSFIPLFTLPLNAPVDADVFVKLGGFIMDTNGFNVTIGEPLVEDPTSTGGGITKNGAGTLTLSAPSTVTGPVTINAGGLGIKAGTTSWQPSTFTHSGTALNFDLGVFDPINPPVLDVPELTLNTTDITVNISGSSIPVASEIKILDYGTKSGSGSLKLNIATLPNNMVAELKENLVDGYYYLEVTSPSATSFTWSGDTNADGTGTWDLASLNWNANAAAYAPPAIVTFPNIAAGGTVTISPDVAPLSFEINNTSPNHYLFAGTGKITGSTGITKNGTGIARFNGAAHDYSGNLAVNAGAVIKQAADATTGNITVAADNVTFALDGGVSDGAGQTLTISGRGSTNLDTFFTGSAVQRGALQAITGANTWAGNVVLASNSGSVINRIGVQNGASLTLTGVISESVAGAPLLFRAGLAGDNITLGGTSAYTSTGQTQIFSNGGTIILGGDNKLPTTSSVFFGSGGTTIFDLNGSDQVFAGISGNAFGAAATITNNGTGPSILTTNSPAESPVEANDYFPALIADGVNPISFVKNGAGTQIFAGSNSYTGTTTVNAGRLEIQEFQTGTGDVIINGGIIKLSFTRTFASGVNLSIASGALFYLDGSSQTLGKLEGAGTIDSTYTVAGIDTLSVGANDATSTFNGLIQQSTARTYALRKIGAGTFTLTGLNTYTGNTTVEDGTLSVAQSNFADASTVTIGTVGASTAVLNLPNAGTDIVAELIIDGVTQPGNGAVYNQSNTSGAITGSGSIQVGVAPPSGYDSWVTTNSVTEGENGDDDKDGIINLVEYALGSDPKASNPSPGTFVGNTLTFTKGAQAKAAGDVSYQIETSTTLETGSWTPAAATESADDISYLLPTGLPGGKVFGRLKITKP
jgi:autotransporter-associated beta strand protein